MKTAKKTGRKQKHFEDPKTGQPVVGLSRRPSDGRWRIIGTQITFTEPDPQKAIEKFRKLQGEKMYEGFDPDEAKWLQTPAEQIVDANAVTALIRGFALVGEPSEAWPKFWAYVANEIITKPKWVAEQTGIEKLAYLTDLKPPEKLPTLAELRKLWEDHATCSVAEMKKVRKSFDHFTDATDAERLDEITAEMAVEYRDVLHESGYGGKTQKHIIAGIRRVLTFAHKDRGKAPEAIKRALTYLECLKPSESTKTLDPKPIEVDDWKTLYKAASGDDLAMCLLMLNGSYYLGEVIDLEWGDIKNGCIVTNREKTGQNIRVCVLWQETIDALAKVQRRGDKIFYQYQGLPIKPCGAFRRFKSLAIDAGLYTTDDKGKKQATVTASQLRDGAYTAAVESGVTFQFCQLLNGHATGMADHYVKRNPQMVKPACEAIYKKYFG